jgi:hypothetical protein
MCLALQVCDVAVLTQLTELQVVGHWVLQGDLQPLSELKKLVVFDCQLEEEPLYSTTGQKTCGRKHSNGHTD